MRLIKQVSLRAPLHAAADALRSTPGAPPDDFSLWAREHEVFSGSILRREDDLRDLLPAVPQTRVGIAWQQAAEHALALAIADQWRPYDLGAYDTSSEDAAVTDLENLAEALKERSPLLTEVADELDSQTLTGWGQHPFTLADALRPTITGDEGVLLRSGSVCDKHGPDCRDDRQIATWADIDALAPGTRAHVQTLVARLTAGLPTLAAADNGDHRGHATID